MQQTTLQLEPGKLYRIEDQLSNYTVTFSEVTLAEGMVRLGFKDESGKDIFLTQGSLESMKVSPA
ncbi:hypothetical protein [Leptolyngbya sp. FACHB-261]|uniref:hypothetical protein n=1 Tax=Leptolyngbya sp. FACHB-261 TaxID=2692806 RepID=UPI001681DD28|nr:hypothetical protein [Leptolyngbya sp. FACHB-261]MBD2104990.1 hypothetical protein [Leptolyngbya sp. FACHB-261]